MAEDAVFLTATCPVCRCVVSAMTLADPGGYQADPEAVGEFYLTARGRWPRGRGGPVLDVREWPGPNVPVGPGCGACLPSEARK